MYNISRKDVKWVDNLRNGLPYSRRKELLIFELKILATKYM